MSRPRPNAREQILNAIQSSSNVIDFVRNPENANGLGAPAAMQSAPQNSMQSPAHISTQPAINQGPGVYGGPPSFLETNGIRYVPEAPRISAHPAMSIVPAPSQQRMGSGASMDRQGAGYPPMAHVAATPSTMQERPVDLDTKISRFLGRKDASSASSGGSTASPMGRSASSRRGTSSLEHEKILKAQMETERALARLRGHIDAKKDMQQSGAKLSSKPISSSASERARQIDRDMQHMSTKASRAMSPDSDEDMLDPRDLHEAESAQRSIRSSAKIGARAVQKDSPDFW